MLGGLLFRSVRHEMSGNPRLAAIITVGAGSLFGALDEWHQAFTGRTADVWDVLADAVGLLVGTVCVALATRWRARHGP